MKRERHTYLTLQTVEAARQGWLDRISAEGRELATERVPLSAALHRVLAEPVAARRSSPAFHGAAMDGIAVNAESTFTASTRRPLRLTIGTDAFWINTGHPLPAGTNAVVMVENVNTEPDGQHVVIEKAAFPWQHVRKLGEDMVASEIILPPGVCIGPYELGALAAGTVTSLSRADGIISVARDCEGISRDEPVQVQLLRPRQQVEGTLLAIGSHDNTLDLIDSFLRREHPRFRLASAHVGSLGGLMALKRHQCHLAGSHLLNDADGVYNRQALRDNLQGEPMLLVRLVDREQGLIVAPGNPLGIHDIADLAREDVRFINRQRGSGTRVLLDYRLKQLGIRPQQLAGYEDEEYTHMNVAAAVLSGRAHTGLAVRAAACALGLDFVPVGVEEYDLVIPQRYAEDERILALLDVIRSEAFRKEVAALGGYGVEKTGQVIWEYDGR